MRWLRALHSAKGNKEWTKRGQADRCMSVPDGSGHAAQLITWSTTSVSARDDRKCLRGSEK